MIPALRYVSTSKDSRIVCFTSLLTMPMIYRIGEIRMIEKNRSGAGDTDSPRPGPASAEPGGLGSTGRLLLSLVFSLLPLITLVTLQQTVGLDLPDAIVGAVVLFSILLAVTITVMLRPRSSVDDQDISPPAFDGRGAWAEAGADASAEDQGDDSSVDSLTGLLTFQPFSQRLLEEFHRVKRTRGSAAVVLVDVNQLGQINEQFGAEVGDQVLRTVSDCLEMSKRVSDILARMGDDEFGLLLLDCDDVGARAFVDRVEQRLARESLSVELGDRATTLWIGICAGVAIGNVDVPDADALLTAAIDSLNADKEKRDRRRGQLKESA